MKMVLATLVFASSIAPSHAAAGARVVLLDDGTETETEVRAAWLTQFGNDIGIRWVGTSEVFPTDRKVWLLGDADTIPCEGPPGTVADFLSATESVVDEVTSMNYDGAGDAVDRAANILPCLVGEPSAEELGQYHFMRGIVAYYAEGAPKATERFEEALLVSPFMQWDTRYPPPVKPSFDAAAKSAIGAKSAFLSISRGVTALGELRIDGVPQDPRTRTRSLYVGTHLVQWRAEGESEAVSWVVDLPANASLALVERGDAVETLLAGDAEPIVTEFTQSQVLAPVERNAGGVLFVAQKDERILFHSYDPLGARWRPVDVLAFDRWTTTGRRLRGSGAAATVLGGVLVGFGAAFAIHGWRQTETDREIIFGADGEGSLALQQELAGEYELHRSLWSVGVGLSIAGGSLVAAGVPITIAGDRRAAGAGFHERDEKP